MNDISLNWKKIARGLPRAGKAANDRAPTIAEIRKLVEYPDRRIKPIVKTMVSSGIRIGAWDYLKWKHVTPVFQKDSNEVTAAKLIVYAGESDEYYTFITPEAHLSLKEWMDFRKDYGEKISGESWVMRDLAILFTSTGLAITSLPSYQPALAQSNAAQEANQTGEQMQPGMANTTQEAKSAGNQTGEKGQSLLNQTGEALQNINPFR